MALVLIGPSSSSFFFLNPDGSSEGKARALQENLIKTMSATSPQHGLAEPVVMRRY